MINSLCAHCLNCEEVKYDGFFCNETGYIEDKYIEEGCENFKSDEIEFFKKKLKKDFEEN